jgi:HAD superfamily hydrolase (TIGR01490 family)
MSDLTGRAKVAPRILSEMGKPAAFFDLDKTIIAKSSTLAFGRPFYQSGLLNRRAVLRSAYAQFVFALAGADDDQMDRMRDYITAMCTGWDVAQIREIVNETLHDIIDPIVYDEAVERIQQHKSAGQDVVIVSSSGEEVVGPIGAMVGADHVLATRMVVSDGKYTGEIERYVYGPAKAEAVRELAAERGYDLAASYAYSDSITDLPLLEDVGHPTAVNPDRALRKIAVERGWPILTLRTCGFGNEHPGPVPARHCHPERASAGVAPRGRGLVRIARRRTRDRATASGDHWGELVPSAKYDELSSRPTVVRYWCPDELPPDEVSVAGAFPSNLPNSASSVRAKELHSPGSCAPQLCGVK